MNTGSMPLSSAPGWESERYCVNLSVSSETHPQNGTPALITIMVQGYLTFKALVGKRQVSLPVGSSLGDLLAFLRVDLGGPFEAATYDDAGQLREYIVVTLNGVHCRHLPDGINTLLKDGDQVAIFPPLAGG